jgi:hypothetical protein
MSASKFFLSRGFFHAFLLGAAVVPCAQAAPPQSSMTQTELHVLIYVVNGCGFEPTQTVAKALLKVPYVQEQISKSSPGNDLLDLDDRACEGIARAAKIGADARSAGLKG